MTDLSPTHIALPQEDYRELVTAAYDQEAPTAGERVGSTLQTFAVFTGISLAVAGSAVAIAKARDWFEERQIKREMTKLEFEKNLNEK